MTISAKLKLAALVPGFVALVIGLALFFSYKAMERAGEEGRRAKELMHSMNELHSLASHFMLYREEGPKRQFLDECDSAMKLMASIRFREKPRQQLVNGIRHKSESLREAFLRLVAAYEHRGSVHDLALLREAEERLAGRVLTRSRDVLSDALRLEGLIDEEIAATQRKVSWLVVFLLASTIVPLTFVLVRTMRRITASIARLRQGTEVVGSGRLDHRIGMAARDEIGELSGAFDRMTERLRDTTVSRDRLGKEVEERRRAEAEVRRQSEWLRVTLTSIGDAVMATDTQRRVTFMNPVAASLTGWEAQEALGRPIQEILRTIDEKTRTPGEDMVRRVLAEGHAVAMANHTAMINREGQEIPIEDSAAPIRDAEGDVAGVVIVFHDVTEKRRAQAAIQEAAEKFRIVAEFTHDWEYWRLLDSRFVYVSPSCERITGYSREEFMQDPGLYSRIIHPDDRDRVTAHLCEDEPRGEVGKLEFRILRRDGRERWIGHVCQAVLDPRGAFLGRRGSDRDITDKKEAEDALRQARDELEVRVKERTRELEDINETLKLQKAMLERSNRDLEDFAHVASHDLQEPLRKIRTFSDLLLSQQKESLDDKSRDYLGRMQSSAERMHALVMDLLRYSRVATHPESYTVFNLRDPVQEALADLGVLCEETEGRVEVGELPEVEADRVQMRQLFQNLIGNALKYRGERKPVVRVYGSPPGPDSFCEIRVEDNGIGFDESHLDKIFKPYQRLHGRSSPYEGTGMGLAICRKIVERHGGLLTARSEPGKGSEFIVRLPMRQSRNVQTG